MTVYLDVVMVLNFLVDWFLLIGANRLCGAYVHVKRTVCGACIGAIYAGICAIPRFFFVGRTMWRIIVLILMGLISYGIDLYSIRRTAVFVLLSMALGGIVTGMNKGGLLSLLAAAVLLLILCAFGFRGNVAIQKYIPVELLYNGIRINLTALADSGNTLRDPVSGASVLVVGAQVAEELLGLSVQQLQSPLETMQNVSINGLRLIPYSSVCHSAGFLLAVRIRNVRIGKWRGSALVAFAPERIGTDTYQALAGGVIG